jgi:hypothetical protein
MINRLHSAACLLLVSVLSLAAERLDPAQFAGFWELQEPAGDTCVVIIKRGGQLSAFWAGSGSTQIIKGTWERDGDALTATWPGNHVERFTLIGDNAIQRQTIGPASALNTATATIRGVRVDPRRPGSLTVDRGSPPAAGNGDGAAPQVDAPVDTPEPFDAPALPLLNAFTGYWKVRQGTSFLGSSEEFFYLHLVRSGRASAALRSWDEGAVTGNWRVEGDYVVIDWPSGRRDFLRDRAAGNYELAVFPARGRTDRPSDTFTAEKIAATDAARYFQAGEFQMLTVVDIRGTWTPRQGGQAGEYIEIEGWGNAFRHPSQRGGAGSDPGKWRLVSDRVVISWIDGSRDVIRLSDQGFFQDSFAADVPTTGQPHRTVPVHRVADRQTQGN